MLRVTSSGLDESYDGPMVPKPAPRAAVPVAAPPSQSSDSGFDPDAECFIYCADCGDELTYNTFQNEAAKLRHAGDLKWHYYCYYSCFLDADRQPKYPTDSAKYFRLPIIWDGDNKKLVSLKRDSAGDLVLADRRRLIDRLADPMLS